MVGSRDCLNLHHTGWFPPGASVNEGDGWHTGLPPSLNSSCANLIKHLLCESSLGHQTPSAMLRTEQLDLPPYMLKAYYMLFKVVNGIKSNMYYVNLIARWGKKNKP